jgi:hypothetical protein
MSVLYPAHDRVEHPLHVVTPLFNPVRFKSRWKLYERFAKMVADAGGILHTVEAAFGERTHVVHPIAGDCYYPMRTRSELWIKENLINLGIQRLPSDWKYVAWIDADLEFARPKWVHETLHQLQHYHVVQMYSEAVDLNPNHEILNRFQSFMWCYHNLGGDPNPAFPVTGTPYYGGGGKVEPIKRHPGFAWAAQRSTR